MRIAIWSENLESSEVFKGLEKGLVKIDSDLSVVLDFLGDGQGIFFVDFEHAIDELEEVLEEHKIPSHIVSILVSEELELEDLKEIQTNHDEFHGVLKGPLTQEIILSILEDFCKSLRVDFQMEKKLLCDDEELDDWDEDKTVSAQKVPMEIKSRPPSEDLEFSEDSTSPFVEGTSLVDEEDKEEEQQESTWPDQSNVLHMPEERFRPIPQYLQESPVNENIQFKFDQVFGINYGMVNEDIMHVPALPEIEDISDHEEKIESETPENNIEERFTENSLENLPKEKEDGELTMSQSKKDNVETKDTLELDDLESDEGLLVINEGESSDEEQADPNELDLGDGLDLVELDSLESDSTLPDTDPSELDLSDDGGSLSLSEDGSDENFSSEDTAPSLGEIDLDDSDDEPTEPKIETGFSEDEGALSFSEGTETVNELEEGSSSSNLLEGDLEDLEGLGDIGDLGDLDDDLLSGSESNLGMPGDDLDLGGDLPPVQDEKESAPAPKLPASAPMNLAEEVELDEEDDEEFDSNAPVKKRSVGESTDPMITTPVPEEQLREDVRGPSDEQMESFSEFRAFEESLQNDLGEPEEHVKEEKSSVASVPSNYDLDYPTDTPSSPSPSSEDLEYPTMGGGDTTATTMTPPPSNSDATATSILPSGGLGDGGGTNFGSYPTGGWGGSGGGGNNFGNSPRFDEDEMVRLQATIKQLREEREDFEKTVLELKEEKRELEQEKLSLKAENDELKIEISILKRRHLDEVEGQKDQIRMSEEKLIFYEGKIKKYQDEFHRLNQKVRVNFNQIQKREKELENQLELITMDSANQIKGRDSKILELKRKIDSLEFNMENLAIREEKSKSDKIQLEDKLNKIMRTLRGSIKLLEEDIELDSIFPLKDEA